MRILLVRHGQTTANVDGLLDTGVPGPTLTDLGRRQAAAIPAALRDREIDAVVTSPLRRTEATARPLLDARGLVERELTGVREVDAGDLEKRGDHEAHVAYLSAVFAWPQGDLDRAVPGGPDGHTFLGRYDDALATVGSWGLDTVVVVSHGAAMRCWSATRVRGVDVDAMSTTPIDNTGLIEIDGSADAGWDLVQLVSHPLGGADLAAPPQTDDPTGEPVPPSVR